MPKPPWHPESLPPLGFRFERDGQSYEVVGTRPYVTVKVRPGRAIMLVEWRTECPTCGSAFVTMRARRPPAARRCAACRNPRLRVAVERRKAAALDRYDP